MIFFLLVFYILYNPDSMPLLKYKILREREVLKVKQGILRNGVKDTAVTNYSNVRVNSVTTNVQNEEQIAVNNLNALNAVAVWRDFRLGYRQVGIGYTFDGGQTWHDTLAYDTPYEWDSDPVVVSDELGNFYITVLSLPSSEDYTAIYMLKSTDGGLTWNSYEVIDVGEFEDKEWIAIDKTLSSPYHGNIYIAWTRFWYGWWNEGIHFTRSTDGGNTWSSPIQISTSTSCQWPVVTVDHLGNVYVAWVNYGEGKIEMVKSTNGGVSFSYPSTITYLNFDGYTYINPNLLVFAYPAITCDISPLSPYRGNLYVVYIDSSGSSLMDVYFTKSTNGGLTWSSPIRLNDDPYNNPVDQFHPWIDVDQNGTITVVFYDRRNDPSGNLLMDVYITKSTDGGQTWTPNERVTSVSSDPSAKGGLIGEYIGLDVYYGKPFIIWTDTREGSQDAYFGTDTTFSHVAEKVPKVKKKFVSLSAISKNDVLVKIISPELLNKRAYIEIFDIKGKKVFEKEINSLRKINLLKIPYLKTGFYFARLRVENKVFNFKICFVK
ncbi:hypothetical protein DRN73_09150 [Candidatus Pacearchaeota archaeon]|nr:MAG: hypothetical protein DRN73_09150 [Candidatus Pacearchaeota archaeon]